VAGFSAQAEVCEITVHEAYEPKAVVELAFERRTYANGVVRNYSIAHRFMLKDGTP
jgi:hypothetical protein